MTKILSILNAIVWGAPALLLILGVGLFLTLRLKGVQLRLLPDALGELLAIAYGKEALLGEGKLVGGRELALRYHGHGALLDGLEA